MILSPLVRGALLAAVFAIAVPETARAVDPYGALVLPNGTVKFPYGYANAHLTCRPLLVCDITLGNQEAILNVAVGDSVRWIVASANSGPGGTTPHVFVKPTEFNLTTNLVVTTTKHTYYIDLTSAKSSGPSRIGFYYPDEEREARRNALLVERIAAAQAARPVPTPSPIPPRLEFRYTMSGDASILPHLVYNDGAHIYLQYEKLPPDLPVPYATSSGGSEQIVNYRVAGTTIIVDGLPKGIDLILNAGVGKHGKGELHGYVRQV